MDGGGNWHFSSSHDTASEFIDYPIELHCGDGDNKYLYLLKHALKDALSDPEKKPDLLFYNAGTDCLVNDSLGRLSVSREVCRFRDSLDKPVTEAVTYGRLPCITLRLALEVLYYYSDFYLRTKYLGSDLFIFDARLILH